MVGIPRDASECRNSRAAASSVSSAAMRMKPSANASGVVSRCGLTRTFARPCRESYLGYADARALCQFFSVEERLHKLPIRFRRQATVCKYVVPQGYPDNPIKGATIDLSGVPAESPNFRLYKAAVEERDGNWHMTGSRAVACVGIGSTLAEAEKVAEQAASAIKGPVFHRRDIGTPAV